MDTIVDLLAKDNIRRAFQEYGIEGTEQAIRRVYRGTVLSYMLEQYSQIVRANVDS